MSSSGRLEVMLPGDCEVRMTRRFSAQRQRIFECHTEAEWLKRWLGPEGWDFAVCENELFTGGRYRWLWRNPQGQELGMRGEYLKIVQSSEIVRTEIFDQDPDRTETIGWLLLTEVGRGTMVTTSVLFPTQAARDAALAVGVERGVAASFDRLELLLSIERGDQTAA